MPWVRIDDHFDEHPKIASLSDSAFALFVSGLAYCNRNLTDGWIPYTIGIGKLRYCDGNAIPAAKELEDMGLWEKDKGGWWVHDYDKYQPSKAEVLAERDAKRRAGQAGGIAAAKARAKAAALAESEQGDSSGPSRNGSKPLAKSKPVPVPVPDDSYESSSGASTRELRGMILEKLPAKYQADVTCFDEAESLARSLLKSYGDVTTAIPALNTAVDAVRDSNTGLPFPGNIRKHLPSLKPKYKHDPSEYVWDHIPVPKS